MIRTIIVDDETLSRIGIQSFIDGKNDIEVVGSFCCAEEALEFLQASPVDIVVTDIEMSEMNGLEFIGKIREKQLADGVIILSCYENFSYAQQAIEKGTDSYMLKHSISEEALIKEILKVYDNCKERSGKRKNRERSTIKATQIQEGFIYSVCTIKWENITGGIDTKQTDHIMFLHLLEDIIEKNNLGTVFAPHNKEIFVIFQQDKKNSEKELRDEREEWLDFIHTSVLNYISENLILGVSSFYTDTKETKNKYEEAIQALNRSFYSPGKNIYQYLPCSKEIPVFTVETYDILEVGWNERFSRELKEYLETARRTNVLSEYLKTQLIYSIQRILLRIMNTYGFSEDNAKAQSIFRVDPVSIHQAATADELSAGILEQIDIIKKKTEKIWSQDDLAEVFQYIDEHLQERITIQDLTEISYMSTTTFCKKFKDRTGMTLIQYLNERRIEKAMIYLNNPGYSLDDIAQLTGFAHTNYLVRVFKKVTSQTISEYKKKISGIIDDP